MWADDITNSLLNAIAKTNMVEPPIGGCCGPYAISLPPLALLFSDLEKLAEIFTRGGWGRERTKTGCSEALICPTREQLMKCRKDREQILPGTEFGGQRQQPAR